MATIRTTIKYTDAQQIAQRISNMALGAEIKAAAIIHTEAAQEAYEDTVALLDLKPESIAMLQQMLNLGSSPSCCISIEKSYGYVHEDRIHIGWRNNGTRHLCDMTQAEFDALPTYLSHTIVITDPEIVATFREHNKPYVELMTKKETFEKDIIQQIDGRTAGAVIKAWPETESVIRQVMRIYNDGISLTSKPMVTPFADLLAKLALALPAPAAQEAA